MLHLTAVGRRSGKERAVILGYYEDGPNLVTVAMNGWGKGEPAWWLNLRAHPDAHIALKDGLRPVRPRRWGRGAPAPLGRFPGVRRHGPRYRRLRGAPADRDGRGRFRAAGVTRFPHTVTLEAARWVMSR